MNPPIQPHVDARDHGVPSAALRLPLRGRKLCLMAENPDSEAARLFHRAATELGAHVAHVRPSLSELSTPHEVRNTARMLGRLYDAVECQGMAASVVRLLAAESGVAVLDGLASRALDGGGSPAARSASVQAGLARALVPGLG